MKEKANMSKYNFDDKIGKILENKRAVNKIEEYIPNATKHPQLFLVKNLKAKNVKGKGYLIGLTIEQENEMIKKLLELE